MGIRYYKRVNLGGGLGLNVSKSGISPSIRTKSGSVGPNSFSIRTGIPGLTYRSGKGKNDGVFWLVVMALAAVGLIAYNLLRFIAYLVSFAIASIFKPEGIDYKNLVITLVVIAAIVITTYIVFFA